MDWTETLPAQLDGDPTAPTTAVDLVSSSGAVGRRPPVRDSPAAGRLPIGDTQGVVLLPAFLAVTLVGISGAASNTCKKY